MSDQPQETAAAAAPSSPGRALAAARQARGMTVTEVALRLKFSPRKIEALEADRYDALPGPTMVRGMIRGYARLVGLDPKPLVGALQRELGEGPSTMAMRPQAMDVPFPREPRRGSFVYVLLSAVVVIAVASVVLEWVLRPDTPPAVAPRPAQQIPAPAPAAPVVAPAPEAPPVSVVMMEQSPEAQLRAAILAGKRIEMVFNEESWVEIRDAEGRIVFSQLNAAGTRRKVEGVAPFSLVIGNAAGVKLRYNDAEIDLAPYTRTDVARLTLK
ncbi:MAG TPA: helix-turn-helix domain-containing protein [Burkholderiales bacterium]|nr:helix-turn-helix domain-containing protein [Burkholderiales bacterium]